MKSKTSWGLLLLVVLVAIFVPLVPNDTLATCPDILNECDDVAGYISIYDKYFSHNSRP